MGAAVFYWETPPITLDGAAARRFEFVTVRATTLGRVAPDPSPFADGLAGCAGAAEARSFSNLGGCVALGMKAPHERPIGAYAS